ncbi:hypothetical protein KC332_g16004 [Hortaea werneckii]|uniref:Uncharacterized protein n=2 Tax=Hortaea werneckii TaxID=91943 RepID=A0A3M7IGD9_HORWE|nr:hypothetical protein KC350_g17451 [Hortaea werneckii]OTA33669.1 hypothetical protein BTJ68_04750 [Hortaea werneckii EXF-2000]KAI6834467.1 hypothetical protein KC358_g5809 [Hortaea werneckii]KAI6920326.1 hypothetical protein KC341_g16670 [Hortaea werneckii]KAI6936066.1 hypothetical protein KC348_g6126 [Hortaea werneckii]
MANGSAKQNETPEQLYASAIDLVEQSQPEDALRQAKKLWSQCQNGLITEQLPALNLLGEISVELGDVDSAKQYFEQAVVLDPEGKVPEAMGGGAEKFLWLAQLCEEGGKASVQWFEKGAAALQGEIEALETGNMPGMDEEGMLMLRVEKKRKLANALCGIVEVYMTDLSWEDDAEARCEALVTQAMTVEDETSPEVLQTLASVRLSQERKEDAQSALTRSLATWRHLDPEDPAIPDFANRIALSRLLMEAEMEKEAMFVLQRLVTDDDQSVEAWYLGGWCQNLIAEKLTAAGLSTDTPANGVDEENELLIALKGSRNWLKMALRLYDLLEYEDDRLCEHAKELVAALDRDLGPEAKDAGAGEEDEWEEWDGIDEDQDQDLEDEDEEMKDS